MLAKAAKLAKAHIERIRQTVTHLPVADYDETIWHVIWNHHWLHYACENANAKP